MHFTSREDYSWGKPNIFQSFSRQTHSGKGILGKLSKGEAVTLLVLGYGLIGTKAIQIAKSDTLKFFLIFVAYRPIVFLYQEKFKSGPWKHCNRWEREDENSRKTRSAK
jgi:hypothetical protein